MALRWMRNYIEFHLKGCGIIFASLGRVCMYHVTKYGNILGGSPTKLIFSMEKDELIIKIVCLNHKLIRPGG